MEYGHIQYKRPFSTAVKHLFILFWVSHFLREGHQHQNEVKLGDQNIISGNDF